MGFESFTQHAEVRFKQDPCLGAGGCEVGNNRPLIDLQFDAQLAKRWRLEAHRDRATALVGEKSDAFGRELGRGMRLIVEERRARCVRVSTRSSCVKRAK